jgi:hypothetical protein
MNLETWLRKRNMTTKQFTEMVGCSRPVIWKVKKGLTVSPQIAHRIQELTNDQIDLNIEKVGRKFKDEC